MSKITTQDIENLTKAAQTANLLFADLKSVVSSESILLSDAAMELLEVVSQTEQKLERLVMAAQVDMPCSTKGEADVITSTSQPATNADTQVEINPIDLKIDQYYTRHGGQWAPIVDNGITIKHLPTGIAVSCDEKRSAHANKAAAMRRLYQILATLPHDANIFTG